ncbi:MAG: hypothetical protein OEY89_13550 [Gammaproteobacteria bacterium]|nr:hypothetical protein [Gammaproteobacteria bacterium]
MNMINKKTLCFLACFILLPAASHAISFNSGTDFNAHYQSYKTDWLYTDNSIQRTSISHLGIGWTETLSEYLNGGLKAGYLDVTQANNPLSTARITEGHYFGIHLNSIPVNIEWFRLLIGIGYTYNNTDKQEPGQNIEMIWHQTVLNAQATFQLIPRLSFTLGAKLTWIDGEERATGTLTQIRTFEQNKLQGHYASIDLATDDTGSIGVSWEGGTHEGLSVYFRRQF